MPEFLPYAAPNSYANTDEVARYLGITPSGLQSRVHKGQFPKSATEQRTRGFTTKGCYKPKGFWLVSDIRKWAAENQYTPTTRGEK